MDPASHSALMQTVAAKWRSKRFCVIWKRDERPPLYQYPVPYPIRADCWVARLDKDGAMIVNLRFSGRRWDLRLKADHGMRRNRGRFKALCEGVGIGVEAALFRSQDGKRLMLKLVGWFPREEARDVDGVMELRTGGDRFLTATVGQCEPWILNSEEIRQLIAAHAEYRQRMSDDSKYEKRHPRRTRERMLVALDRRCQKMRNRLDNFLHSSSRLVVEYAKRHHVAEVQYDATDASYFPSFPWFVFGEKLKYKMEEANIRLTICERSGDEKSSGTARSEHNQET
jgi:very-short-patch-repair endonuclease